MSLESIEGRLAFLMGITQGMASNVKDIKDALERPQIIAQSERSKELVPFAQMNDLLMFLKKSGEDLGFKIEAIKLIRSMTGCGLKEAKDLVEKYF